MVSATWRFAARSAPHTTTSLPRRLCCTASSRVSASPAKTAPLAARSARWIDTLAARGAICSSGFRCLVLQYCTRGPVDAGTLCPPQNVGQNLAQGTWRKAIDRRRRKAYNAAMEPWHNSRVVVCFFGTALETQRRFCRLNGSFSAPARGNGQLRPRGDLSPLVQPPEARCCRAPSPPCGGLGRWSAKRNCRRR